MPQATNLVIKNASNVDKTLTLISPAAGFGSNAMWRIKEGAIVGAFPTLTSQARKTGNKSQLTQLKFAVPCTYVDSTTGRTYVGSQAVMNCTVSVPDEFPEAMRDDFATYCGGIVKDVVIKAQIRDGVPAT